MKFEDTTNKILRLITHAITGEVSAETLTKNAVQVCKEIMDADACSIFLIDESDNDRLIMKASCGYKNNLSNKAEYFRSKSKAAEKLGVTGWIAQTGKTFKTDHREQFKRCPEYSGKYDKRLWGVEIKKPCESFFGAPLQTSDKILGVLKVESQKKKFFNKQHEYLLQIIASIITSSLHNLMIIKSFHSLFEPIGKLPMTTTSLYNQLSKVCAMLVHAEACSIFIVNEKNRLVLRGDYGHTISLVDEVDNDHTYESGEGITGTVFQTGSPYDAQSKRVIESNPSHKGKLYESQWGKKHVCHSLYQFPIGKGSPRLGVVKVENKRGIDEKPIKVSGFSKSDKQILEILANSVVPLIATGQMKETIERELGKVPIDKIFSRDLLTGVLNLK